MRRASLRSDSSRRRRGSWRAARIRDRKGHLQIGGAGGSRRADEARRALRQGDRGRAIGRDRLPVVHAGRRTGPLAGATDARRNLDQRPRRPAQRQPRLSLGADRPHQQRRPGHPRLGRPAARQQSQPTSMRTRSPQRASVPPNGRRMSRLRQRLRPSPRRWLCGQNAGEAGGAKGGAMPARGRRQSAAAKAAEARAAPRAGAAQPRPQSPRISWQAAARLAPHRPDRRRRVTCTRGWSGSPGGWVCDAGLRSLAAGARDASSRRPLL